MWVYELAVVMYFASEVRVVFSRGLEDDLGAIREIMLSEVDFSKRTLPDEFSESVIANMT